MSLNVEADLERTSQVIRAGRKLRGLTQTEVAKALGVSQSVISKYESGFLMPDASFWFYFCDITGIDAHDSFLTGLIYNRVGFKKDAYQEASFKIPKEYLKGPFIKTREVTPFIASIKELLSPEIVNEFVKKKKMDEDVFVVQDYQLSLKFLIDLSKFVEKSLKLDQLLAAACKKNYEVTKLFKTEFEKIAKSEKLSSQVSSVVDYFKMYDQVFDYKIESVRESTGLVLDFKKKSEGSTLSDSDLNWYRQYKLDSIKLMLNKTFNLKVTSDHTRLVVGY